MPSDSNFTTAISCLMNDDSDDTSDNIIRSRLQAFEDKYFMWLTEIPGEIRKIILGDDSTKTKLTILPKTPSVKKRARVNIKVIQENENNDSPTEIQPAKIISVESQIATVTDNSKSKRGTTRPCRNTSQTALTGQVVVVIDSPKGRPKRSCRNRPTSYAASFLKAGPQTTKARAPPPEQELVSQNKELEVSVAEADSKLMATGSSQMIATDRVSKSKAVSQHVGFEEVDNHSPSVRDRARAYETMLNYKTKSPVKAHTPNSANRNFASATISSLAKSSPQSVVKRLSSATPSPRVAKLSFKPTARQSRRSSRRSSRLLKSRSEHPAVPPNATRSKLALVKKSANVVHQPLYIDSENIPSSAQVVKKGKNRSSLDSALSSATSTMSPKSSSCDGDHQTAEENYDGDEKDEDMDMNEGLDLTHTVITEVYDLSADGKEDLVDYEKIQTKTLPVSVQESVSDTQVSEEESSNNSSAMAADDDCDHTYTKDSPIESAPVARTTRTRARAVQAKASMDTSVKSSPSCASISASYTELKSSSSVEHIADLKPDDEVQQQPRTTRTRTRAKNQQEVEKPEETGTTRTRKRQQLAEASVRDVSVVSNTQRVSEVPLSPEVGGVMRSTRSRMRQQAGAESIPCGAYDEVVAGSPAIKMANGLRCSKKRPVEEYGNSPRSKRSRSCAGMAESNSTFNTQSILLTSSPRRAHDEDEDTVNSLMTSVRKPPHPFVFTSSQKSSFMKRTPAFARTNSKVYSFLGNTTPTQNNSGALSSFLKRNTPKSKTTPLQMLQEQKKVKLQEKENKEKERLRRAAETKKQRLEEQKRLRDDRLRKVTEAREKLQREELEQKERFNKKLENQATLKDRIWEEKLRAENEKKELREKKMLEANSRRRQEEEDRERKRTEMEEEARRQQEWLQRKKEYEEEERKRHLEEEKRKHEERMQKIQEEKAKQRRLEEEKRERLKKERERQLAIEKAEREIEKERMEREKREEKERRLEELRRQEEQKRAEEQRRLQEIRRAQEQEKIRIMEAAHKRAQEEAMRIEKEREAKKIELQKLIDHSKNAAAALNNSTIPKESTSSYMITPVKTKVYKPSLNPDNYDIADKGSDESTDEDDAPKKKIPTWAFRDPLNAALIKQYRFPPDVKNIFRPHLVEAPDLTKLFPTSRQRHRFKHRTSSAIWTSPMMKK